MLRFWAIREYCNSVGLGKNNSNLEYTSQFVFVANASSKRLWRSQYVIMS